MKNIPLLLFSIILICACHHLKPVAVYENPRLKKDVILYNNNKILLLHQEANNEYEFATGHYNIEDSAVLFRNEIAPTQFSFKFGEERDLSKPGYTFYISFDFLQGEKTDLGGMDLYFMINDTMRIDLKLDTARTGMMYGVSDSRIKHVRGVQMFEVRSCFSTQRYLVKDSTNNQIILHMNFMPGTGKYNNYIWGAMRTAVLSPDGDSMLLNMSSCGTPSARTDTLFRMNDPKKYRRWPMEILPPYIRQDFVKMDN